MSVNFIKPFNVTQSFIIIAKKNLLAAVRAGKVPAGQQFSLAEFARLAGLTSRGAKRLLAVWQILREIEIVIEETEITTKGGVPRYVVKVQARPPVEKSHEG